MQLVEVVLFFKYLHAAASEYAMHCEERNRQWAEHRGDPVKHCEKNTQQWKTTASRPDLSSQHGNLKLGATERLQAWCKADLVFAHAWTLHTWQFNSQFSEATHIASPHACLHHRHLIEELSLKSRSIGFRNNVCWLLWERLLERSMMTSLPKNLSSVNVHSSSSCSKPIYVLSFMKEKRRYLGECFPYNKSRQWSVALKQQKREASIKTDFFWWSMTMSRVVDGRCKTNIYTI